MKIGIDCRLAGGKHAGIGRYIEELVSRVIQDQAIQWVLFFYEENQIELPKRDNVKIVIAPVRHYTLAEQLQMPGIFAKEKLDVLHVPHLNYPIFYTGRTIITIHDLLWHNQSNAGATTLSPWVHALKYHAYKFVTNHAVFHAQKILVPAETVKKDLLRIYPEIPPEKIVVTYEGVGEKFTAYSEQPTANSKVLFYTGSLYPHKNVMLIVKALKKLPVYELFISSSRTVFVDEFLQQVKAVGLADRVHHLGRLTDEKLLNWYQKSLALVQPSLSEGFGLTGVEAMATGLPVIASDIPVFHEIYRDGCLYFDPKSEESFVNAVRMLESSDRKTMIKEGQKVANSYTWDKMAKETLEIYMNTL